jgi:hypothetical protein
MIVVGLYMWIYTKGDDERHGAIIWLVALVGMSTYRVVDVAVAVRWGRRPAPRQPNLPPYVRSAESHVSRLKCFS